MKNVSKLTILNAAGSATVFTSSATPILLPMPTDEHPRPVVDVVYDGRLGRDFELRLPQPRVERCTTCTEPLRTMREVFTQESAETLKDASIRVENHTPSTRVRVHLGEGSRSVHGAKHEYMFIDPHQSVTFRFLHGAWSFAK